MSLSDQLVGLRTTAVALSENMIHSLHGMYGAGFPVVPPGNRF